MNTNKIKKIIFLIETHFNKRDYNRFGIDILIKNGFDVEIIELSCILSPKEYQNKKPQDFIRYKNLIKIKSINHLIKKIKKIDNNSSWVIINLTFSHKTNFIYKIISKRKCYYSVLFSRNNPDSTKKNNKWSSFFKFNRNPKIILNKILFKYIPHQLRGIRSADLILLPTQLSLKKKLPIGKKTKIIFAHSFDYDLYLKENNNKVDLTERPAVFLDGYMAFHPDHIMSGKGHSLEPENYYRHLNRFLTYFEKRFNTEVIIAIHPRADNNYSSTWFPERKSIKGRTLQLIKQSSQVILHNSFSMQYAVLFNKPMTFLSSKEIDKLISLKLMPGPPINWFANYFNKKVYYIDELNYNIDEVTFEYDNDTYLKFKNDFIKDKNSKDMPYWEIFIEQINLIN